MGQIKIKRLVVHCSMYLLIETACKTGRTNRQFQAVAKT